MSNDRFRAFSFVDRITHCADRRIEGHYTVPAGATLFPASLMAEAVGQLAAWSSMSELDFAWRPVAGLAGETRYERLAKPGDTLTLEADIARCDSEAVAYGGRAFIGGDCVLELIDCVGPMLPMDDFDAPAAVRADFETLRGSGAQPDRFTGVPAPHLEIVEHEHARRLRAMLRVPSRDDAAYFADHFPRRPVFPGTLLLDALAGLATQLASEALPASAERRLIPRRIRSVKIRAFTAPGTTLELDSEVVGLEDDRTQVKVTARNEGKTIATGRIEIGAQPGAAA